MGGPFRDASGTSARFAAWLHAAEREGGARPSGRSIDPPPSPPAVRKRRSPLAFSHDRRACRARREAVIMFRRATGRNSPPRQPPEELRAPTRARAAAAVIADAVLRDPWPGAAGRDRRSGH